MKTKYNFISRFSNKVRASSVVTMFSLAKEKSFVRVLSKFIPNLIKISTGKTQISPRLRRFNKFLGLLFRVHKYHGSAYAVKWLKANHMAVQRSLSSSPMTTLRELEPQLPLTRLINGLPPFIGTMDRKAIRNNCPSTIRLWLSILSLYRVIEAPVVPKLSTITDPYRGSVEAIDQVLSRVSNIIESCPSRYKGSLRVDWIERSLKSGPNNKVAVQSVLTDAIAIAKYPEIYDQIAQYCKVTNSIQFFKMLNLTIDWCGNLLMSNGRPWVKHSKSVKSFDDLALGKLAFKEEAAGKLRIFAIADIWTQSLFRPLHDNLFKFLKGLPNDGTFDQEASYKRALDKSIEFRSVFSVDLSSATDRLPIDLQVGILDKLVGVKIGDLWKGILVDRPYMIRSNKYIPEGYVYYKTGQPMGCLSSWAMLAVTHHFIMQYCSHKVYNTTSWNCDYEILGDDLVIFDHKLYLEYLTLMSSLDVGINLSKSLISDHLSAFEFAKRTGVNGIDVSGISIKQLIAENSLLGRVNQVIYFGLRGLVPSIPILLTILGGSTKLSLPLNEKDKASLINPLMAILGYFARKGDISLESAVSFITDPQDEDLEFLEKPSLPIVTTLQYAVKLLNSDGSIKISLKDQDDREDLVSEEVIPYMADSMLRDSLSKIQQFTGKYDSLLKEFSLSLVNVSGISIQNPSIRTEDGLLYVGACDSDGWDNEGPTMNLTLTKVQEAQLVDFAEWILLKDRDPDDLADELYNYLYNLRSDLPPLSVAETWCSKVDNFLSSFDFKPSSKAYVDAKIPSLLRDIRASGKLSQTPFEKLF